MLFDPEVTPSLADQQQDAGGDQPRHRRPLGGPASHAEMAVAEREVQAGVSPAPDPGSAAVGRRGRSPIQYRTRSPSARGTSVRVPHQDLRPFRRSVGASSRRFPSAGDTQPVLHRLITEPASCC